MRYLQGAHKCEKGGKAKAEARTIESGAIQVPNLAYELEAWNKLDKAWKID